MLVLIMSEVKNEIRVLGVDDGPFDKFRDKKCLVTATVFRGGIYMDGLLSCHVDVDGNDATDKLVKLIKKSRHLGQLKIVMINGIAFAGFNVIDISQVHRNTRLPVIVIIRHKPNLKKIENALRISDMRTAKRKMSMIKRAGKIHQLDVRGKRIYFQTAGLDEKTARQIILLTSTHGSIPEPLRISHMISSGIVLGESHTRA